MKFSPFTLLFFATYAAAEGYLASVTIDGKPYFYKSDDVIREVASFDPVQVKNINTVDIACGPGAKTAGTMAKASPGSEIKVVWSRNSDQLEWPYSIGPMLTYLASCGSQSCEKLDVSEAKWFKISELGLRPNGTWIQEDAARGFPITIRLPPTLRAGNYMARVEMINLANAYTKDQGAQFFPYCVQLGVGGSQSGVPEKGELVTFPGAYKANDAGIYVPNLFGSQSAKNYTFPGGCLAKIAGGTCSSEDIRTEMNTVITVLSTEVITVPPQTLLTTNYSPPKTTSTPQLSPSPAESSFMKSSSPQSSMSPQLSSMQPPPPETSSVEISSSQSPSAILATPAPPETSSIETSSSQSPSATLATPAPPSSQTFDPASLPSDVGPPVLRRLDDEGVSASDINARAVRRSLHRYRRPRHP